MEDIKKVIIDHTASPVLGGNHAMIGRIQIVTKQAKQGLRLNMDTGSFGELDGGLAAGVMLGKTTLGLSGRMTQIAANSLYFPGDATLDKEDGEITGLQLQAHHGAFSLRANYSRWNKNNWALDSDSFLLYSNLEPPFAEEGFKGFRNQMDSIGLYQGQQFFADLRFSHSFKDKHHIDAHVYANFKEQAEQNYFQDNIFFYTLDTTGTAYDSFHQTQTHFYENPKRKALWMGIGYQHHISIQPNHHLSFGTDLRALPLLSYSNIPTPIFYASIPDNFTTTQNFPPEAIETLYLYSDSLFSEKKLFNFWSAEVFVHDFYRFNKYIAVQGGLRLGLNSQTKPVLAPEASLILEPFGEKTRFHLSYAKGYRLPSLLETQLAQNIDSLPAARSFIPERNNSFELVWKQQVSKDVDLNISLYHQRLEDIIWNEFANPPSQVDSTIAITGISGDLDIQLLHGISSYLNYNFNLNKNPQPNLPSPLCKFGLKVPFLKHFTLFTEGQYNGDRLAFHGKTMQSYFLLNANLLIRPQVEENHFLSKMSLSFRIYNILDEYYEHPFNNQIGPQSIPQNGRTWQGQVTFEF